MQNVGFSQLRNVGFQASLSGLRPTWEDAGTLTMSVKELDRVELLRRVIGRRTTQWQGAAQLGLSLRQLKDCAGRCAGKEPPGWCRVSVGVPATESFRRDFANMC